MPVPKKRTTSSSRGQRRSHYHLKPIQLIFDQQSGKKVPRRLLKAVRLKKAKLKGNSNGF